MTSGPWPPASPPGVDLDLLAHHVRWPRWWVSAIAAGIVAGLLVHPTPTSGLALASPVPLLLVLGFPVAHAVLVVAGPRLFVEPALLPLQLACVAYGPAVLAALGACSRHELSPAYALMILMPAVWGHLFPANPAMAASMLLSPPVLRVLTVPGASARSIAIAAGVGALVTGGYLLFSWRRLGLQRRERRALLDEALGAPDARRAADRWVALRLHDRLSGVLFLARARVAAGAGASLETARLVAGTAHAALGTQAAPPAPTGAEVAASLTRLARELGLEVRIVLADGAAHAPAAAWRELDELVGEQLANHARHGSGGILRLRLDATPAKVCARLEVDGRFPRAAAGGRGRRNLALRVDALGGVARWSWGRRRWSLTVTLPLARRTSPLLASLWLLEALTFVALPAIAWLVDDDGAVFLTFLGLTLWLGVLQVLDLRSYGALREQRRRALQAEIGAATPGALERARASLSPLVLELERAVAAGDPAECARVIARLAPGLVDVLGALEDGEGLSAPPSPATRA